MTPPHRKLLIFTYYWPPAGGPGVQRFLKFCKFLPEFGWEPIVITPKNGSYPYSDNSLLNDVPTDLQVFKTKSLEPFAIYNLLRGKKGKEIPVGVAGIKDKNFLFDKLSKYVRANFFIPDARKGWNYYAIKQANELLKNIKIEAVITTGPPQSTHLIGLELKKIYSLPWIADLRDPWTTVQYNQFLPKTKKTILKDQFYENEVLRSADHITVATGGLKEEFINRNKNIEIIYNGFDESDMYSGKLNPSSKFTLSYIGNFKPNQNVEELWNALSELCNEDKMFSDDFQLTITGTIDNAAMHSIKKANLENNFKQQNFVTHHEATRMMFEANMLLFIILQYENNKLIITGKLFEYLASRTPVLAIGPTDGNASIILNELQRNKMLNYHDKEGIKNTIMKYYHLWKHNHCIPFKHDEANISHYSRRNLTQKLSQVLNKITVK